MGLTNRLPVPTVRPRFGSSPFGAEGKRDGPRCSPVLVLLAFAAPGVAAPSGPPVRIGGTLALTGPLAPTALLHKIAGETYVEELNKGKSVGDLKASSRKFTPLQAVPGLVDGSLRPLRPPRIQDLASPSLALSASRRAISEPLSAAAILASASALMRA